MKLICLFLPLFFSGFLCMSQDRITTRGVLQSTEFSFCQDLCSYYYLDPDSGYSGGNITSLPDPVWLNDYVGEHVEISGEYIWCVECGALNIETISIIEDENIPFISEGILFENYDGGDCMDNCDEFRIEADLPFEDDLITSLGQPETLTPYVGEHLEVFGEYVTCVECSAIHPGAVNILFDDSVISNGSFENDGSFDTDYWNINCQNQPDPDTPDGAGIWSLRLETGNTQGCFPGSASQSTGIIIPGQIFTISCWIKSDFSIIDGGFTLSDQNGNQYAETYSNSTEWIQLSVTDTLFTDDPVELMLTLDAGLIGGPATNWINFDQIVMSINGQMLRGDVNGDHDINVLDILRLVSLIIDAEPEISDYEYWSADMNLDGNLDVLDILIIVNLITG